MVKISSLIFWLAVLFIASLGLSPAKAAACRADLLHFTTIKPSKDSAAREDLYKGSLSGRVTTADLKPAAAVRVVLKGTSRSTYTDEKGYFAFHHLRPGTYELRISFIGYATIERSVSVENDHPARLDVQLRVSAAMLKEVVVSSRRTVNEQIPVIGGMHIRIKDLPKSVSVVDRSMMDRQQALTLGDVIRNVPGVYVMGETGGVGQEIGGRGYGLGSTNTFKNGVQYNNGLRPEVSSLEKVEFLKGSAALLLGNVAAGGVLNLVTKKPQFEKGGSVSMRVGSYGLFKPSLDIYGPVSNSKTVAFRINTTFEKANSFRDEVHATRYYINPSFLIKAGTKTDILLEGDYLAEKRTLDYGVGAVNFKINDIPRSRFLGVPWSYNDGREGSITLTITHHFSENWQLQHITGYYSYRDDLFGTTRPGDQGGADMERNGNWVRGIQRGQESENFYSTRFNVNGKFNTGTLKHQVQAGITAHADVPLTTVYDPLLVYDSINVFDLDKYPKRTDVPTLSKDSRTKAPVYLLGAYVQDLISLTGKLKLLAGARLNYAESRSTTFSYEASQTSASNYEAHPVTPQLGVVYEPSEHVSLYADYANSFTLNKGIDTAGQALPPSYIHQYEAGIKSDWFQGLLSLNISVYSIVNSNLAQTSQANGNTNRNVKELEGQVTGDGLEAALRTGSIHGFQFTGGYSYNHTRYTRSNTYKEGSSLQYVPSTTANASVFYSFSGQSLKGLRLSATGLYVAGMKAGKLPRLTVVNDNRRLIPLPDFARIDVAAAYTYQKLAFGIKLTNLFNAIGYYAHEDESINPIAPREFSAFVSLAL